MNPSGLTFGIVSLAMVVIATIPDRERQPPPAAPGGTRVVLLGTGNPPADPDRSGPATASRRQRHAVPRGFRRRRRAAREVGGRRQRSRRARSGQAPRRLRHASAFRPHGWLSGSDSDAVGAGTARAAGSLRSGRHQGDDRRTCSKRTVRTSRRGPKTAICTRWARFPKAMRSTRTRSGRRRLQGCQRDRDGVRDEARHGELRLSVRHARSQHRHLRRHESHAGDDRRLPGL